MAALRGLDPAATFAGVGGRAMRRPGIASPFSTGDLRPNADEAARRRSDPPILLVLPGSRRSEINRLGAIFGAAIAQLAAKHPVDLVLPTLPHIEAQVRAATADWPVRPRIAVDR